jgi:anthranilate synthase component 2
LKKIALIDNYDSFTYNLVHFLERSGDAQVSVFLNDKVTLTQLSSFQNFIISPGPGLPKNAGIVPEFLNSFSTSKNILGVCLGHQAIAEFFETPLKNLSTVFHGVASTIQHFENDYLFKNIPSHFKAGRYHSWVISPEKLNPQLEITAKDENGEIMAIKHKTLNLRGVQFHPESVLSEYGQELIQNWIDNI